MFLECEAIARRQSAWLSMEASDICSIRGRKCSKMWNYSFRLGLFCDKLGAACECSRGTRVVSANPFPFFSLAPSLHIY